MASRSGARLSAVLLLFVYPALSVADTLKITSNPPGATVELDGVLAGTTPFEKDFPGGYFHKTLTSMGSRLEHPMVARISLTGYATKELQMADGPMNWISVNGRNHGEYWLFKSDHFNVDLRPISEVFTGGVAAKLSGAGHVDLQPELSLEELVRVTKPAVVYLKGLDKSGTGFFVTETGVIATNAHVARGEESLLTLLPEGQQLEAKVVYIDADLDIALAKVEGTNFPHLTLADAATVRWGKFVPSTLANAISRSASMYTTLASSCWPSGRSVRSDSSPLATCAFVAMTPVSVTKKPVPDLSNPFR